MSRPQQSHLRPFAFSLRIEVRKRSESVFKGERTNPSQKRERHTDMDANKTEHFLFRQKTYWFCLPLLQFDNLKVCTMSYEKKWPSLNIRP